MVCSRCQKLAKGTALATPAVKKKSEMYHGSSASKPTLGQTGVGKVLADSLIHSLISCHLINASQSKLLSKSAKNPYAQYARYVHPHATHSILGVNALQFVFQVQIENYAGTLALSKMRL